MAAHLFFPTFWLHTYCSTLLFAAEFSGMTNPRVTKNYTTISSRISWNFRGMSAQNRGGQTHRRWSLTHPAGSEDTSRTVLDRLLQSFSTIATSSRSMNYLVLQLERAPTTGYIHAQGAIALSAGCRLGTLKKWLPQAHWEPAQDWPALLKYCQKMETRYSDPVVHGTDKTQGQRSDLTQVVELVQSGLTMTEIAHMAPVETVKYFKGLQYLQSQLQQPDAGEKRVALFWGLTGTGKTRLVFDRFGDDLYTVFDNKAPWFDGYVGQKNVLFDECGFGDIMHYNKLKRYLDRYPVQVPIKGGAVWWKPTTIVLTSNTPLDEWYPGIASEHMKALRRRMRIFEFPQDKELARAWIYNTLVDHDPGPLPQKRDRSPVRMEPERSPSPEVQRYLEDICQQDEFELFRD